MDTGIVEDRLTGTGVALAVPPRMVTLEDPPPEHPDMQLTGTGEPDGPTTGTGTPFAIPSIDAGYGSSIGTVPLGPPPVISSAPGMNSGTAVPVGTLCRASVFEFVQS
jgi:hypothetical protein